MDRPETTQKALKADIAGDKKSGTKTTRYNSGRRKKG